MGKLLTVLGISEDLQGRLPKTYLMRETFLEGLQNVYANASDSPRKDQLAYTISSSIRDLLADIKAFEAGLPQATSTPIPTQPTPPAVPPPVRPTPQAPRPTPPPPTPPQAPKPQPTPPKPQQPPPTPPPPQPEPPQPPQQDKPKRGRPPKPKPDVPKPPKKPSGDPCDQFPDEDMTLEELKEAYNVIAELADEDDEDAKMEMIVLKLRIKCLKQKKS